MGNSPHLQVLFSLTFSGIGFINNTTGMAKELTAHNILRFKPVINRVRIEWAEAITFPVRPQARSINGHNSLVHTTKQGSKPSREINL